MAKERLKNVTIPVYTQQTLDRLNQLFPEGFSKEETLNALLDKAAAPEANEQHQEELTSLLQQQEQHQQEIAVYKEAHDDVRKKLLQFTTELLHLTTTVENPTDELLQLTTTVENLTTTLLQSTTDLTTTVENLTTTLLQLYHTLLQSVVNLTTKCSTLVEQQVSPDALVINAPEWSRRLLDETARRLSERYNKTITPQMILLDMFNRYTIERWNQWFYPFCITDQDLYDITGYTAKELKTYLHNK